MTPTSINPMNPITEDDIADFLANTPDFFQRHAQLLSSVHLLSPDNHRSVSLQERQAQMLRDKIRALEMRIMDMIRHGNENMIITEKLQKWACELLQTPASERVPSALKNIEIRFQVPQVAVRLAASNPSSIKRRMASFSEGRRSSKRKSEMRLAWSSVRLTNFFIGYAASLLIKKQISHIDHIDNNTPLLSQLWR